MLLYSALSHDFFFPSGPQHVRETSTERQ